jgi:hypothetical protein
MTKLTYEQKAKLYGELAATEATIQKTEANLKSLEDRKREIRIQLGDLKPSWNRDPMADVVRAKIESVLEAVTRPLLSEDVNKRVCAAVPDTVPDQVSHHLRILAKDPKSGVRHNGHRGRGSAYYFRAVVAAEPDTITETQEV